MTSVQVNIPDGFQGLCDRVTSHNNSLSWITFHTNTKKKGIQTNTSVEQLSDSQNIIPAAKVFNSIRDAILERAQDDVPTPQFILCNVPVKSRGLKKSYLFFISLCHEGTSPLVNFTHATSQAPILQKLNLDTKVFQNKTISITTLDELTLEAFDPQATYDDDSA